MQGWVCRIISQNNEKPYSRNCGLVHCSMLETFLKFYVQPRAFSLGTQLLICKYSWDVARLQEIDSLWAYEPKTYQNRPCPISWTKLHCTRKSHNTCCNRNQLHFITFHLPPKMLRFCCLRLPSVLNVTTAKPQVKADNAGVAMQMNVTAYYNQRHRAAHRVSP